VLALLEDPPVEALHLNVMGEFVTDVLIKE
jgi:hypothetical protein